jgi:hypothetical protein
MAASMGGVSASDGDDNEDAGGGGPAEDAGATEKKRDRSRSTTGKSKANAVRELKRDASGRPILPFTIKGGITIHSLGTIVSDRDAFHKVSTISCFFFFFFFSIPV